MTDSEYLTVVYSFSYFGPARIKLLLSYFKSAKNIWMAKCGDLVEIGISRNKAEEFEKFRNGFSIEHYFERLNKLKIKVVTVLDKNYPKNLRGLDGAPFVLYFKGRLKSKDIKSVAIVGSRKMTQYGQKVTEKFSRELSGRGITIISGLARGIDTVAHKGALAMKGRTIAVLGNGLDFVYPPENTHLAEEIVKAGGAIVSEYPLGYPVQPNNFRERNRIISGISSLVLVIEGAERSGTLLTATHAAEQGKTVFAVPGEITSPTSFTPHFLIKNGAKLVTDTNDILEEIRSSY